MQPARSIAVLLAAAAATSVHAQAIWRCGDSYSQQPCAGGTTLAPVAAPAPAPDRGNSVGARDQRLADSMERDRLHREALAQATPSLYVPAPAPASTLDEYKSPEKKATRKLDVFTASVPGSGKAHKADPKAKAKAKGKDKGAAAVAPAGQPLNRAGSTQAAAKPAKPAKAAKKS